MATTAKPTTFTRTSKSGEVQKVLDLVRDRKLQVVDVKFCDLPGTWQHFSIPASALDEDVFREGLGFDGSSIRGFQAINESDMLLLPDPASAFVDPVLEVPTLSLTCDIYDPVTLEPYSRDPRFIAFKAEEYLKTTGIATTSYWGPEAEFFIFNSVRFDQNAHEGYYHIDSEEGIWNSGRNGTPNLGHRPRHKEGYFPVPPIDRLQDVRSKIMLALIEAGIPVEVQHHEVATAGQAEIDIRFGSLVQTADRMMTYKYIVKNVCHRLGLHGDVHAEAAVRRQRVGHALPPVAVEREQPALLRRDRLRLALRAGPVLHRRTHHSRPGPARALRPDHQQLPAAGAGLRGARQPDVLGPEPVGDLPDPDVLQLAQGQAGGVPGAGSDRPTRISPSRRC